jgi:multiple sugar transport system substrate-binding protein
MSMLKLTRRQLLAGLGLGAAGAMLAACQPKIVEVEKVVTQVVKEVVKETVMVAGTPQVVEKEVTKVVEKVVQVPKTVEVQFLRSAATIVPENPLEQLVAKFEEENEGYTVKILTTATGDDYFTKLVTMTAAGTPPDIFDMPPWKLDVFKKENMLAELKEYADAWGMDLKTMPEALLQEYTMDGMLLGLPVMGNTVHLIGYNKDLFDEAGVAYPQRYWTWDDCLEASKLLTIDEDGDGDPEIWGLTFNVLGPATLLPYLWTWGADFYNYPELNKCTLNSPIALEALEYQLALIREHKVSPPPEMGAADLGITFAAGKVAMANVTSGSWKDPKDATQFAWPFKFGLVDYPKKFETRSLIHGNGLSISRITKNRDAAWTLMQFLNSEESQIFYSERMGTISGLISVGADYAFKNLPAEDLQVVKDCIEYAWSRVHWRTPIWDKSASGTQVPQMQNAWLGEQTVKEALDNTCRIVDEMFAELEK